MPQYLNRGFFLLRAKQALSFSFSVNNTFQFNNKNISRYFGKTLNTWIILRNLKWGSETQNLVPLKFTSFKVTCENLLIIQ